MKSENAISIHDQYINIAGSTFHDINFSDVMCTAVLIGECVLDGMAINGILVTDLLKSHKRSQ